MAYNTKEIIKDIDGNPVSQYYNKELDIYEVVEGANGGNKVVVQNNDLSLIPILEKLSQLTGTVFAEETRESNELQRIAFFEMLQQMLADGELKGEQGVQGLTGKDLEFIWRGTELGVRVEGQTNYIYVNLKGEKGDTGSIDNLDSTHIETALGFIPKDYVAGNNINIVGSEISANIPAVTKESIGLFNVDNIKQMPISGGVLENYTEKLNTTTGVINLNLGNTFTQTITVDTTYSITNTQAQVHSFTLILTQDATPKVLTFPASIKWQGETIPDLTVTSKTYVLTFVTVDSGVTWLAMFGGEF